MTMDHDEFRAQIKQQFASGPLERGTQHPLARLLHHVKEGELDLARIVAEEGPAYLRGGDRLTFASYVARVFPEQAEAEQAAVDKERAKEHEARMSGLASKLKARTAEKVERRQQLEDYSVRGWNTPMELP
jgi:hypothetical protein